MGTPFIGEIRMFAGTFAPSGWALCNGQSMSVAENEPLFSLIGTTYGGDGQTSFNLPNLQSRVPVSIGVNNGQSYVLGQQGGNETVTMNNQQLPVHSHLLMAAGVTGNTGTPTGSTMLANEGPSGVTPPVYGAYTSGSTVTLNAQSIQPSGGNQPHPNIQPYLAITFIISLDGIYPQAA